MKYISIIALVFLSFSCALEQISPSDYNDAIFVQQMKVKNLITDLTKAPDDNARKELAQELFTQSSESLRIVKEIGPFRGDESLIKEATPLFEFYLDLSTEIANTEAASIPMVLDNYLSKQMEMEQKFLKGQGRFAEKYELFL